LVAAAYAPVLKTKRLPVKVAFFTMTPCLPIIRKLCSVKFDLSRIIFKKFHFFKGGEVESRLGGA
jgi:hypothetical protein